MTHRFKIAALTVTVLSSGGSFAQVANDYEEMHTCSKELQSIFQQDLKSERCPLVKPDPENDYLVTLNEEANAPSFYIFASNKIFKANVPVKPRFAEAAVYQMDIPSEIPGKNRRLCLTYTTGMLGGDFSKQQKFIPANESCGPAAVQLDSFSNVPLESSPSEQPTRNKPLKLLSNKIYSCEMSFRSQMMDTIKNGDARTKKVMDQSWEKLSSPSGCTDIPEKYSPSLMMMSHGRLAADVGQLRASQVTPKAENSKSPSSNAESGTAAGSPAPSTPQNEISFSPEDVKATAASVNKEEEAQTLSTDGCIRHKKDYEAMKSQLPKVAQELPMYFSLSLMGNLATVKVEFDNGRWRMTTLRLSKSFSKTEVSKESPILPAICIDPKKPSEITVRLSEQDKFNVKKLTLEDGAMKTKVDGWDLTFATDKKTYDERMAQITGNSAYKNDSNAAEGTK